MIIDGKLVAKEIQDEIKAKVAEFKDRKPCLVVCIVGNIPASITYVNAKVRACKEIGIQSIKLEFPNTISQEALIEEIRKLNVEKGIDGILVQLPLPDHIDPNVITESIDPHKDVDGLHPMNFGRLLKGSHNGFVPCTPLGVMVLLERYKIEIAGKHALVIGRSNIVGKPMGLLLMKENATVTLAHSHTRNLADLSRQADIIVTCLGKPGFLKANMVKDNAVVIDVGINRLEDANDKKGYRLVGDADFAEVSKKCSYITPVPGGVGPMTIAMLLSNTLKAYLNR